MSRFITADRNTDYLLPPSLSEWLPEGHLARFVAEIVGYALKSSIAGCRATLIETTYTSPNYQFYALAGGPPYRPGLKRVCDHGKSIFVEVWSVPEEHFGSFVAGIPAPLGIGKMELIDGRWLPGFICEPYGLDDATDITDFQNWRKYIKSIQQ